MFSSYSLTIVGWLLLASVASFVLTGFLRCYALKKNLLDIPNARSSHSMSTPRGGGLAIVLVVLTGSLLFWWWDLLPSRIPWVMLGAGGLVALVGLLDDHGHVAARWRLLVHFVAAACALMWLGGLPPVVLFGATLDLGWLGYALATVYLVWLINLYNFMDGIDGIASIEAITVCLGGVVLYWLVEPTGDTWIVPGLLLAAVAGFLPWNFPRAKIFMGDAGSGFLGLMLGVLSIQAAWVAPKLFWGWVILLGVFMVDATITLIRRILRKEKFYEAHCSHAYQHAARQLNSHIRVTLGIGLINLLWLLPIAALVVLKYIDGVIGVLITYIPLIILAIYFKAGTGDAQKI